MARAGVDGAALVLRIAVGTVLIWAGYSKSCHTMPVQGERAAALANVGLLQPAVAAPAPTPSPAAPPASAPAENTTPADSAPPAGTSPSTKAADGPTVIRVSLPATKPASPASTPANATPGPATSAPAASAPAAPRFSAADFPEPVQVARWKGLALILIENQVNPQGRRIVPLRITANGPFMKWMALSASWIELIGGAALVLGAMTRLAGLLGAGVLAGAMWTTELGPVLGSKTALLGILPDPHLGDPALASTEWARFLLQLLTFAGALALAMLGPGRISADHWFWGGPDEGASDDEDDDEDD